MANVDPASPAPLIRKMPTPDSSASITVESSDPTWTSKGGEESCLSLYIDKRAPQDPERKQGLPTSSDAGRGGTPKPVRTEMWSPSRQSPPLTKPKTCNPKVPLRLLTSVRRLEDAEDDQRQCLKRT
ncbi:hypothetical protein J4Q44_G00267620 [Coregonus suidteri]|uniref:Uncharacterized protein n=1 Tax=Coregonus suidteri TaxID=861788 RepID=A0AAN8QUI5_9TELE